MPFVRKTDSQGSQPPTDTRKLFIGRTGELLFFVQNILKPVEPTHNIISIWGQGGVGKSTLLSRLIDEAHSAGFKDYCLTATVDELQTSPASIMEKFATQLHMRGAFEKALKQYKKVLRTQETEQKMLQDVVLRRAPDFSGAAVESVPFVGPLLGEGVKATSEHLLNRRYNVQRHNDAELLEDQVNSLTRAFVEELNQLAETQVLVSSLRFKKRRVILFFDTFEQLAAVAAPWLLDYFLPADININIVMVTAGREPIERSVPDAMKRWLSYIDTETIYWIPLNSFTEDETRAYLIKRNIADPERISTIWQLSQGLPLYLSLLTLNRRAEVDTTANVVANFLRWIPDQEHIKRRLALDGALFSRPFNQDDLQAFPYLAQPNDERSVLYYWLIGQPFVSASGDDGRYRYHELARRLFSRHLFQRSQKEYYATRSAIAEYYKNELEKAQIKREQTGLFSDEWIVLVFALAQQLLALPDETSHVKAIEYILYAYENGNSSVEVKSNLQVLNQELQELLSDPIDILENTERILEELSAYIEADLSSQPEDVVVAADNLLHTSAQQPSFSTKALASIFCRRGLAYQNLGEYQRALADFDQMIDLDPDIANYYNNRGNAYYELKDYHRAILDFQQALKLDPNLASAYRGLILAQQ
jgi:tetratricopeptide (TPR) repeat protein